MGAISNATGFGLPDPLADFAKRVKVDLSDPEPDFLGDANAAVKAKAGDVQKTIPNAKGPGVTEKIRNYVSQRIKSVRELPLPPYDEILYQHECKDLLVDCLEIVDRYRSAGYDANVALVSRDLMRLNGNLVHMSGVIGYLNASVDHAESARELLRSDAFNFIKEGRHKLDVHVTDAEANHMARSMTHDAIANKMAIKLVADTLRTTFYALRSFSEELSRIAHRTQKTEKALSYGD